MRPFVLIIIPWDNQQIRGDAALAFASRGQAVASLPRIGTSIAYMTAGSKRVEKPAAAAVGPTQGR